MDTKGFLKEIRSIIREEIEYALEKKLTESKKKPVKETIDHGVSLYKQAVVGASKNQAKQVKQQPQVKRKPTSTGKYSGIQDILEETRRSLQESYTSDEYSVDGYDGGQEMYFDTNSLNAFAAERMGTVSAIPSGINPNQLAPEVAQALTRDYSALMAKINEKKGR